jgi:hypothetical protein
VNWTLYTAFGLVLTACSTRAEVPARTPPAISIEAVPDGQSPASRESPRATRDDELPFVGSWVSTMDGSILILGRETYLFRFPYQDAIREIQARIVEIDPLRGRLVLRETRVLQGEVGGELNPEPLCFQYLIKSDELRKDIGACEEEFNPEGDGEVFLRRRNFVLPLRGLADVPD